VYKIKNKDGKYWHKDGDRWVDDVSKSTTYAILEDCPRTVGDCIHTYHNEDRIYWSQLSNDGASMELVAWTVDLVCTLCKHDKSTIGTWQCHVGALLEYQECWELEEKCTG
jgi:hypothetical protein